LGYSHTYAGSLARAAFESEVLRPMLQGTPPDWTAGERIPKDGLHPETLHPPGVSLLTAGLWRLTGVNAFYCLQAFTSLFDASGVILIFWLSAAIMPSHPVVARRAAILYAIFPPLLAACASRDSTSIGFMPVATMLAVWLYYQYLSRGAVIWFLLSAFTTGLSAYFRSDALLLTAFLCLVHSGEVLKAFSIRNLIVYLMRPVVALTIALFTLLPWAIHNDRTIGKLMFTSTAAGCTLVTGLGAYPNPWNFGPSDEDRHREAQEAGLRDAFGPEADEFFRARFFSAVKSHPKAYLLTVARRFLMPLAPPHDWNLLLRSDLSWSEIRSKGINPLKLLPYLLSSYWPQLMSSAVGLIGLCGMVLALIQLRFEQRALVVLALPYFYVTLSHVFTHMAPYYLLPAVFCQLIGFSYVVTVVLCRVKRFFL